MSCSDLSAALGADFAIPWLLRRRRAIRRLCPDNSLASHQFALVAHAVPLVVRRDAAEMHLPVAEHHVGIIHPHVRGPVRFETRVFVGRPGELGPGRPRALPDPAESTPNACSRRSETGSTRPRGRRPRSFGRRRVQLPGHARPERIGRHTGSGGGTNRSHRADPVQLVADRRTDPPEHQPPLPAPRCHARFPAPVPLRSECAHPLPGRSPAVRLDAARSRCSDQAGRERHPHRVAGGAGSSQSPPPPKENHPKHATQEPRFRYRTRRRGAEWPRRPTIGRPVPTGRPTYWRRDDDTVTQGGRTRLRLQFEVRRATSTKAARADDHRRNPSHH